MAARPNIESLKPSSVRKAIEWAILAPSGHNTQPWHFRVLAHQVELYADRTRALPVVDPHDRELTVSCGAALYGLRVGFAKQGIGTSVAHLPEGPDSDLIARVRLSGRTDTQAASLSPAMASRHTYRRPFEHRTVSAAALQSIVAAARSEDADFVVLDRHEDRERLAQLVMQGDEKQFKQPSFRRELAMWLHSNRSETRDGMPGTAFGYGDLMSVVSAAVVRTFDLGAGQGAKDRDLMAHSPVLAVLATRGDSPEHWVAAGQALMKLLLVGVQHGLQASYLNQPVEVPELREELNTLLPNGLTAQLVLRMGHARPGRITPRRPVEDVIEWLA